MTARVSIEPRRSPASLKSARELPVLFHLIDVSRPRSMAKTLSSAAEANEDEQPARRERNSPADRPVPTEAAEAAGFPAVSDAVIAPEPAPVPVPVPAPVMETAAVETPIASVPLTKPEIKPLVMPEAVAISATAEAPAADDLFEQPAIGATETPTEPSVPSPPRSPSRTGNSTSWFAAHGKYIAIAFVIALIGTIYFASTSGRGRPPIADENHSHPGEASLHVTVPASSQATVIGEAKPGEDNAKVAGNVQEASPAQLATESEPQTDLHPPTIPQLEAPAVAEAGAQSPADPSLFPWVKEDERVAARPESSAADASAAPAETGQVPPAQSQMAPPAAQSQYPATSQPTPNLAPQYPATQYPTVQYPTTSPSQPAYPATNTPNQHAFPPGPAGAQPANGPALNGPTLAPPAGGSQYYPQDNSARGSRYERTGSGLY